MKYKKIILGLALLLGVVFVLHPGTSFALFENSTNEACQGLGNSGCDSTGTSGVQNLITNVINLLSAVVGITAVIMIMVGGFKYITAGGDSAKIGSAKNTIVYAIIGVVIVALAQFFVNFVIDTATKDPAAKTKTNSANP